MHATNVWVKSLYSLQGPSPMAGIFKLEEGDMQSLYFAVSQIYLLLSFSIEMF